MNMNLTMKHSESSMVLDCQLLTILELSTVDKTGKPKNTKSLIFKNQKRSLQNYSSAKSRLSFGDKVCNPIMYA